MELSQDKQAVVMRMREAVAREVRTLTECLQQADEFQYELNIEKQYLEAENKLLMDALIEHGIDIPNHIPGTG